MEQEHEHTYLNTFVREGKDGKLYIIYAGEKDTDKQVMVCVDCNKIQDEPNDD